MVVPAIVWESISTLLGYVDHCHRCYSCYIRYLIKLHPTTSDLGGAVFHSLGEAKQLDRDRRGGEPRAADGHARGGSGSGRHSSDVHAVRPGESVHPQVWPA